MALNDIYQLVVAFSNDATGKGLSFTVNGRQNTITAPTMSAMGDDVKDWFDVGVGGGNAFKTYIPSGISLTEVTLRRMKPLEASIQSYTTGLPIAGTAAGDQYTGQAAPLVTLRTANIGKSYRGRIYLPPVGEAFVGANSYISAADAEDIAEGVSGLFATLVVDNFQPAVWSRKLDLSTDIANLMVDRVIRTQRRRQDRAPVYVAP